MSNENLPFLIRFIAENPSAIAMFDRDMRYVAVSERWKSDYNLHQDLIGLSHYEVFPEIGGDWRLIHRRALAGETIRSDLEAFRRQDGTIQWLRWVVWPWLNSNSQVGGIVISSFAAHDQTGANNADRGGARPSGDERPIAVPRDEGGEFQLYPSAAREQREIIGELRAANLILNHLPQRLFDSVVDHLTPVSLGPDAVLVEPQQPVDRVYFPLDGLITMIRHLADGTAAEVAAGGRGGFSGLSVVVGDRFEETETRVLLKGTALVIRADALRKIMTACPEIRTVLMKFNAMLMAQMSVSLTCMARHSLDERLARWLLTASVRTGDTRLNLRQESLAMILGVRRTGVSEAINRLVAAGIVVSSRRQIVIRDRARLEARSCECFHEAEAARRRSAPDIVISPPIPPARLRKLVDRFTELETCRRQMLRTALH